MKINTNVFSCVYFLKKKPPAHTLPDATPPIGQIHPLSKMAVVYFITGRDIFCLGVAAPYSCGRKRLTYSQTE